MTSQSTVRNVDANNVRATDAVILVDHENIGMKVQEFEDLHRHLAETGHDLTQGTAVRAKWDWTSPKLARLGNYLMKFKYDLLTTPPGVDAADRVLEQSALRLLERKTPGTLVLVSADHHFQSAAGHLRGAGWRIVLVARKVTDIARGLRTTGHELLSLSDLRRPVRHAC